MKVELAGILLKALDGTGSEYQTEVMSGSVIEQIHQAANAHLSDVVVFGQHVMIHRGQATSGGQMPYKAMFAQNRLVVGCCRPASWSRLGYCTKRR